MILGITGMKWRFLCAEFVVLVLMAGTPQRASAQAAKGPPDRTPSNRVETPYRGGLVNPPLPKPKFTLTDTSGASFDLSLKTQGFVTLVFFGYTHCPDMCPTQMAMIGSAFRKLPADVVDQFKVVFVTTDPARDDSKVLRSWLDNFDKRFIGLTGSDAAIRAAQIASNLPPAEKSAVRPDGNYDVGHAAFVLAYTKDNLAHVIYPVGVKVEDLTHDLPLLIKETWGR
jgi:protein SCO1/2